MKKLLTLAATALVAATATLAPAEAETVAKTCRFQKLNQRTIQMPCFVTFQGRDTRVTWADGAVDIYTQVGLRNGIAKFQDGLGNDWYGEASGKTVSLIHENADREVFIF